MAGGITPRTGTGRTRRPVIAAINITPLVDVMLVLLVIFMVTAPLLKAGIPIRLPNASARPIDQHNRRVVVTMARDGSVFLDGSRLPASEVADRITVMPRNTDGSLPMVVLRADASLDYGRIVAVMGDLNRSGITSISLLSNPAADHRPAGRENS